MAVYFFHAKVSNAIKIGVADDVSVRFETIQRESPERLSIVKILYANGHLSDYDLERDLHMRFSSYRLHGEWFKLQGTLLEYLSLEIGHGRLSTKDMPDLEMQRIDYPKAENELAISIKKAAQLLGISRSMAYQYVAEGIIPSIRLGRRLLVPRRKLENLIDQGIE